MGVWDNYDSRINNVGGNIRDAVRKREVRFLDRKLRESLSYQIVNVDGVDREATVLVSDNMNQKYLCSMVGEDFDLGAHVILGDAHWLIVEKDHDNHLYAKCKLEQCNFLLKWIDKNAIIHEQWCIINDGTKYLTGEWEDNRFIVTRGDARISLVIARNEHTLKFDRQTRFLIYDPASNAKLAFVLSKPLTVGKTYYGKGCFSFVLAETAPTDEDNFELMIADYYKYYPKDHVIDLEPEIKINPEDKDDRGRENWL